MTDVYFHADARRELKDSIEYYDSEKQKLGKEFLAEVERSIGLLKSFPRIGQKTKQKIRKIQLARFPYHL